MTLSGGTLVVRRVSLVTFPYPEPVASERDRRQQAIGLLVPAGVPGGSGLCLRLKSPARVSV